MIEKFIDIEEHINSYSDDVEDILITAKDKLGIKPVTFKKIIKWFKLDAEVLYNEANNLEAIASLKDK